MMTSLVRVRLSVLAGLLALFVSPRTAAAVPSISNLNPSQAAIGASVTITGSGFGATQGASTVSFNGATATSITSWSASSIVAIVPSGASSTGNVVVTVSGSSGSRAFTVLATPTTTGVTPIQGPVGASVTIAGSNFGATRGSSTVRFNSTNATSYTSWSSTSIVCVVPTTTTGPGTVVVHAAGVDSNSQAFTVLPKPAITSISPGQATVGTSVTITGTGFGATQGTSTLKFNNVTATPTSWSDTSIVTPVPAATSGNVIVMTGGGSSTGFGFVVIATPAISSLSPSSGAAGTLVTINGSNFQATQATGSSTVTFNGVAATPTSWTATQIKAPVPAGASAGPVVVTAFGLTSNTNKNFNVLPTPAITALSQTVGDVGTVITIFGSNFGTQSSSTIKFNGTTATPSSWTTTRLIVPVPAGATTGNVVVHTSGVDTNGVAFAVSTLTSITMTPGNPSVPLNSQQRFWATGTYANGASADLGANGSWTSSDTSIAPVDATGLTTGTTQGTATIQVARGSVSASQNITITGGVFHFVGSLNVQRIGHTATKLQNGKVLIIGGGLFQTHNENEPRSELYDPATGNFTFSGNLLTGRIGATATLLPDGRVLIVGGGRSPNPFDGLVTVPTSELYDPATGTFSLAASSISMHEGHQAVLLADGRVLIFGGTWRTSTTYGDAANEIYDPATDSWTLTGSMTIPRMGPSVARAGDGTIVLAGGINSLTGGYDTDARSEYYDPATGAFAPTGNLVFSRAGQSATRLNDGTVLMAGGTFKTAVDLDSLSSAEIYAPSTRTFASTGSLSVARSNQPAVLLSDGSVVVVGGSTTTGTGKTGTAEIFDPTTHTWRAAGSLARTRYGHTATLLDDGTILIAGGDSMMGEIYAPVPPAPPSLQITPTAVTMVVGQTRQFLAVDSHGFPRTDATWSVSDPSLVTISPDGRPVVTAIAAGTATLTATIDTVTSTAQITIAADQLPTGTVRWAIPYAPGFLPVQVAHAVPTADGPNLYSIESNGAQSTVTALSADGRQLWQTQRARLNATSVPDSFGGLIVVEHNTCDPGQTDPLKIVRLDPVTGDWLWEITAAPTWITPVTPLYCYPDPPQMAVRPDGSIVIVSSGNTSGLPEMMIVDQQTGNASAIFIPASSYRINGSWIGGYSPIAAPVVDANGKTYVEYETRVIDFPPRITLATVTLLTIAPSGAQTTIDLATTTDDMNFVPGRVIPDGQGGVIATWAILPSTPPSPPPSSPVHPYKAVHISATGVMGTPYELPFTPNTVTFTKYPRLVLSSDGVTMFATDDSDPDHGPQVAAIDMDTGTVHWSYQAPSTSTTLTLLAATSDAGVAIDDAQAGIVQLDVNGVASTVTGPLGQKATYSWTSEWYLQGSQGVSSTVLPIDPDPGNEWATPAGNASQNGIGVPLCACEAQQDLDDTDPGDPPEEDPSATTVLPSVAAAISAPPRFAPQRTAAPTGPALSLSLTGTYLQLIGDPGLSLSGCTPGHCHSVGPSWKLVAATMRVPWENAGNTVYRRRVSSVHQFAAGLTAYGLITKKVVYIGHAGHLRWPGTDWMLSMLYPGDNAGSATNIDYLNVGELSNAQLGPDAEIWLYTCRAGLRPTVFGKTAPAATYPGADLSIAQQLANQLNRNVYAWKVGLFLSNDPNKKMFDKKWPTGLPMYLLPENGGKAIPPCKFTPNGSEPTNCGGVDGKP